MITCTAYFRYLSTSIDFPIYVLWDAQPLNPPTCSRIRRRRSPINQAATNFQAPYQLAFSQLPSYNARKGTRELKDKEFSKP